MYKNPDLIAHDCRVVSIDILRKNASQPVKWTNVMTTAPQANAEIAFFYLPGGAKHLVLARNYGDITGISFDDAEISESTVMRVPTVHYSNFLEPYSKTLILPVSEAQYDALEAYLASMNLPVMGPLTSARAVYNMQKFGCTPAAAMEMAQEQKTALVEDHMLNIKLANKVGHKT